MEMNEMNEMDMMELTEDMLEEITGGKQIIATGNVKVRRGPGLNFGVLGYLDKGDTLTYDGASEYDDRGVKWYRVKYRGSFGWVSSRYSKKR